MGCCRFDFALIFLSDLPIQNCLIRLRMAIYDRPYYGRPRSPAPFGVVSAWSVTTWLIAINVAVFVLDRLAAHSLTYLGYFSAFTAIDHLQIWRFITFQFLHLNVSHIFFNMLALC